MFLLVGLAVDRCQYTAAIANEISVGVTVVEEEVGEALPGKMYCVHHKLLHEAGIYMDIDVHTHGHMVGQEGGD